MDKVLRPKNWHIHQASGGNDNAPIGWWEERLLYPSKLAVAIANLNSRYIPTIDNGYFIVGG